MHRRRPCSNMRRCSRVKNKLTQQSLVFRISQFATPSRLRLWLALKFDLANCLLPRGNGMIREMHSALLSEHTRKTYMAALQPSELVRLYCAKRVGFGLLILLLMQKIICRFLPNPNFALCLDLQKPIRIWEEIPRQLEN